MRYTRTAYTLKILVKIEERREVSKRYIYKHQKPCTKHWFIDTIFETSFIAFPAIHLEYCLYIQPYALQSSVYICIYIEYLLAVLVPRCAAVEG